MSTNYFIMKMISKTILLIIFTFMVYFLYENTVITNEIAMGQMENSNGMYLLMVTYNKIRTYASIAYTCVSGIIVGTAIYDIYIFIKGNILLTCRLFERN